MKLSSLRAASIQWLALAVDWNGFVTWLEVALLVVDAAALDRARVAKTRRVGDREATVSAGRDGGAAIDAVRELAIFRTVHVRWACNPRADP